MGYPFIIYFLFFVLEVTRFTIVLSDPPALSLSRRPRIFRTIMLMDMMFRWYKIMKIQVVKLSFAIKIESRLSFAIKIESRLSFAIKIESRPLGEEKLLQRLESDSKNITSQVSRSYARYRPIADYNLILLAIDYLLSFCNLQKKLFMLIF